VDHGGNLLVVETGADRVSMIDLDNGNIHTIIEGIKFGVPAAPNAPPTWIFSDISVGSSGALFVSGDVENVLYRLDHYLVKPSRR
jgi:hypothetical protein